MTGADPAAVFTDVNPAEWVLWQTVPDLAGLRELTARFCLGELSFTPGHYGPRNDETTTIGPVLAAANRAGFLTEDSQPGYDGLGWDGARWRQRAAVSGFATAPVLARLRDLVADTRLALSDNEAPACCTDHTPAVAVTTRAREVMTTFGAVLSHQELLEQFDDVPAHVAAAVAGMRQVTIVDPRWGPHRLLWDRLSELRA